MKPYYEDEFVTLYHGSNMDVLPELPRECTACVTDPPYGLSFMGKAWDHGVPGVPFWQAIAGACLPGAPMLAFGGTRTYHRLVCAIEDAGLEVRDCLQWIYGSGFPKSLDVSKAIDKAAGVERTEVIGARHRNVKPFDNVAGWNQNDTTGDHEYTAPATEAARTWQGYGTALKPAHEPICLAMNPLDGTFAQNALEHGVAGINIDGSRIPTDASVDDPRLGGKGDWSSAKMAKNVYEGGYAGVRVGSSPQGRWPANIILSCPDDSYMLRDDVKPEQLRELAEWMDANTEL